jgi:hypothetical protein
MGDRSPRGRVDRNPDAGDHVTQHASRSRRGSVDRNINYSGGLPMVVMSLPAGGRGAWIETGRSPCSSSGTASRRAMRRIVAIDLLRLPPYPQAATSGRQVPVEPSTVRRRGAPQFLNGDRGIAQQGPSDGEVVR